jgi:hypothetical protein
MLWFFIPHYSAGGAGGVGVIGSDGIGSGFLAICICRVVISRDKDYTDAPANTKFYS